jgi:outer membrane lipoprotein-sorting protein
MGTVVNNLGEPPHHPKGTRMETRRVYAVAACIVLGLAFRPGVAAGDSVADFLGLLARAESAYAHVHDYTAMLISVERVGEALEPESRILLKFQRPFKVYMRWVDGPAKGREGLYVAGAHDGKFILAEPESMAKFFIARLDPSDPRILQRSRHPVTDVGIGRLLEIVGDNARRAAREKVLRVHDHGLAEVAGRRVRQVEAVLPKDPGAGYYAYRVTLSFDEEHHLPIRVVVYDWRDRLVADYTYSRLVLNPGLSAADFDIANPDYGFSRWRLWLP